MTAVHLLNRSPTNSLQGNTPYEAWHGRSPAVGHLRTFGCIAYVKELNQLGKLDDRGKARVFIGYVEGAKAYRTLDPVTQHVRVARDVVFDEGHSWNWAAGEHKDSAPVIFDFSIKYAWTKEASSPTAAGSPSPAPAGSPASSRSPSPASGETAPPPSPAAGTSSTPTTTPPAYSASSPASLCSEKQPVVEFATPLDGDEERLDAYHDDKLLHYHRMSNILRGQPLPPQAERDLDALLHLTQDGEPASYVKAEGDPAWCAAMEQELKSIEQNHTWQLVNLPNCHCPITLKWVFKLKKNEAGMVIKHKACLVAHGFV